MLGDTTAVDMVTDMVEVMVDITEGNGLLMLTLKPSHGTDTGTLDTHTPMADTDTHTLVLITTLESDLLMLNPTMVMEVMVDMVVTDMVGMEGTTEESDPLRLSHTTDMVATDTVATATAVDTDTVDTDMDVKVDKS